MRKRIWLVIGSVVVSALLLFFFVLWLSMPVHRINARSAAKLHSRMKLDEIVAVLRVPPGDYRSEAARQLPSHALVQVRNQMRVQENALPPAPPRSAVWISNEGVVMVAFDDKGGASSITFASDDDPTWLDKVRDWLHLP